jgi:hypothetical protein
VAQGRTGIRRDARLSVRTEEKGLRCRKPFFYVTWTCVRLDLDAPGSDIRQYKNGFKG